MKTEVTIDNLVLFPSAKNFPEFFEENLPDRHDMRFEDLSIGSEAYDNLEAYMNREGAKNLVTSGTSKRLDRAKILEQKIQEIQEAKTRIDFYLSEIENYLPQKS